MRLRMFIFCIVFLCCNVASFYKAGSSGLPQTEIEIYDFSLTKGMFADGGKRINPREALAMSSGATDECAKRRFLKMASTSYYSPTGEVYVIVACYIRGEWVALNHLKGRISEAKSLKIWNFISPNARFENRSFFDAAKVPEKILRDTMISDSGAEPVFSYVYVIGTNESADYLLPFCFRGNAGCGGTGKKMDGVIVVNRTDRIGTYWVRALSPTDSRYCAGYKPFVRCNIYRNLPFYDLGIDWLKTASRNNITALMANIINGAFFTQDQIKEMNQKGSRISNEIFGWEAMKKSCLKELSDVDMDYIC